jgi:hypothetical protein
MQLNNAMDIFKISPRTNCRKCGFPACLAFAAAVFAGEARLSDCPYMRGIAERGAVIANSRSRTLAVEEERLVDKLRSKVAEINLDASEERLGASFTGDALKIKMLGKDFFVHRSGTVVSDCHIHGWVTVPLLDYVIHCAGKLPSGKWVPFRELEDGASRAPLFQRRVEEPLKRVADIHTDLFELMVQVFGAEPAPQMFNSDIAVILHPLPLVPILVCYWKADGEMESSVNLFFDDSASENLSMDALYRLSAGLVVMFEKVAATHGA